jgi:uncharacterized membrane protein YdjX (TVP38/TMEM64 family)
MHDYSVQFAQKGSLSVFLARQIPISGLWVNCLLGLTHVGHRDFLVGTAIGMLPEAIPATLVGASAAQMNFAKAMSYLFAAVAWFVIIAIVWRWLRRSGRLGVAAPPRAENAGLGTGNDVENQS